MPDETWNPYVTDWTHDDGTMCDAGRQGPGWCGEHGMWMRLRVLPAPAERPEVPGA